MGRSTPKTNESVSVPKDGPISQLVSAEKTDRGAQEHQLVGTKESLELLSIVKCNETTNTSPSQQLWSVLCNADQIRPQLQALQAYKSKILLLKKNDEIGRYEEELIGTYRLLLEWSLSNDIPTPLRRAILSNLGTLDSVIEQLACRIRTQVIESLFDEQQLCWSNPLGTLFEVLNYEYTRSIVVKESALSVKSLKLLVQEAAALQPILDEQSFYNQTNNESQQSVTSRTTVTAIQKCVFIANTLKLFLTEVLLLANEETLNLVPLMKVLQCFLWDSITCQSMPADELNAIGVTYGQTLMFQWKDEEAEDGLLPSYLGDQAVERVSCITKDTMLPRLNALAAVQGIAATLPNEALIQHLPPIFSEPLASYLLEQCRTATGAAVRLSGLRALHTLINRCVSIMSTSVLEEYHLSCINELSYGTLEVILQLWESPPVRQVATAVPGLFRSLLVLLRESDALNGKASSSLQMLVKRILDLPSNRKGKYIALESLLPEVGATFLIEVAGDDLIASLIERIGDGGQNIVALSDLLRDLLSRLRLEMNQRAGILTTDESLNKKQRRKREKTIAAREEIVATADTNGEPLELELPFHTDWVDLWCPHLAHAIVSGSANRRKHISTRCLPLLVDIVGGSARRQDATYAFSFLLEEVRLQRDQLCRIGEQVESYAGETESLSDRLLWASLEIAKHASLQKLLKPPYSSISLISLISETLSDEVLKSSLTHSSESIRMIAFASIQAIVPTYFSPDVPPLNLLEKELSYWKSCLPYSSKSGNKAFIKELFQNLYSLLNRLSDAESACHSDNTGSSACLPLLTLFVCDFLVSDVLLHKTAYPGTVEEKEGFALALFQCIHRFASQDMTNSSPVQSRGKLQCGSFRTNPREIEVLTMRFILEFLLTDEVMSALFSLIHSSWDNTRAASFACLCQLVEHAHSRGLPFPNRFLLPESKRYVQARYTFLASSPRQREADTGSRVLALIGALYETEQERIQHNADILAILDERLHIMAGVLGAAPLTSKVASVESGDSPLLGDGSKMPMAHGLMMALRLTVESNSIALGKNDLFYESFAAFCCRAIQMSLAVVADVTDSTTLGVENPLDSASTTRIGTPLNVNTGAIGANAGFSSIIETDEDETLRCLAYQRIIVGSWLMTKEACASLASTITCREFDPSLHLVERVGNLLISTLTALKHQGAAFAAHRALQEVVTFCFATSLGDDFANLPRKWAKRLMQDISGVGSSVRDSTLRRSTGYALAFLSIMRSEPPPKVTPRIVCPDIMATLVGMSLPPAAELETFMERVEEAFSCASLSLSSQFAAARNDAELCDQTRTRVHALNILRLIILDAPLASVSRPFIGDAIMSSMIGYEDSRWAVRNSATMVFSAVMLRVVDADKNASTGGNAITATELFRSYPTILSFLLNVLEKGVRNIKLEANVNSSLYPVLLLLSRLQPVAASGEAAAEMTDTFVPVVLQCLQHHQHKVRLVAARALANISTDDSSRHSFVDSLLVKCKDMMSLDPQPQWNTIHGSLLGIQHILSSRSDSWIVLLRVDGLLVLLDRFVHFQNSIFWCPPACASVALEILHASAFSTDESMRDEIGRVSLGIVAELRKRFQTLSLDSRIGEALLGAGAARVCCDCSLAELWDPTEQRERRQSQLTNLSFLLENDIIDVRLEAAKAFKKTICSEIDMLLSRTDVARQAQIDVLVGVARALQKALMAELNLFKFTSPTSMHPPTVRRLSRCLIECCHALRALAFEFESDDLTTEALSSKNLWGMGLKMSELDDATLEPVSLLDTDKSLNGNAAELMGFAIEAWFSVGYVNDSRHAVAELRLFVQLLVRLIDDQEFWRIRHSVAVAIETSRVLLLDADDDTITSSQLDLTNELLTMLQDGDSDVRFVAGRAILQASCRNTAGTESASSSQLVVEKGYGTIPERFSGGEMSVHLLQSLVASCQGIVESLDRFDREFAQSEQDRLPDELLNLDTRRKIFEDEISNPFEEVAVANQLRSVALVESGSVLDSELAGELFALCSAALGHVLSREIASLSSNRAPDIAHEVTWSNSVFPYFHSLLVGSIAAVYLGAEDPTSFRGDARRIVLLLDSKRENTIHPCILKAIETLASSSNDVATYQSLLDCCFLLPVRSSA